MAVALTNPRKETFIFTLYHSVYCAGGATCECKVDSILRPVPGGLKYHDVTNPVSVYLESGETKEFHSAVLNIQQVATALSKGRLTKKDAPAKAKVLVEAKVETNVESKLD